MCRGSVGFAVTKDSHFCVVTWITGLPPKQQAIKGLLVNIVKKTQSPYFFGGGEGEKASEVMVIEGESTPLIY